MGETLNFPSKNHLNALIVVYDIGFIDWLCPIGYLNAFCHSFRVFNTMASSLQIPQMSIVIVAFESERIIQIIPFEDIF